MFDFSWTEILLVAIVALVVIGPKDLPRALRTAGQWAGRARAVAREFQSHIDQMVRESELEEVRKTMNTVTAAASGNPHRILKEFVDPTGEIEKSVVLEENATPSAEPAVAAEMTAYADTPKEVPTRAVEAAPEIPKSGTNG